MQQTMEFTITWYVLITVFMAVGGVTYNHFIEDREGSAIPTSLKVVIGVVATEVMRVVRLIPLLPYLFRGTEQHHAEWMTTGVFIGLWAADVFFGYGATGIPMIRGDLRRRAQEQDDKDTVEDDIMRRAMEAVDGRSS